MASGSDIHWLFHVLAVLSPVFISVTFFEKTLFAAHVALMTFAFLLVMPEGIFIVTRVNRRRKLAMRFHLGLQLLALLLALSGVLAMFAHRHARLKRHFSTLHAWLGVAAVLLAELGALLGVLLYFNALRASRTVVARLHMCHRVIGRTVITCGFLAIILALKILDVQNPRNKGWKTYFMACAVVAQFAGMSSLFQHSSAARAATLSPPLPTSSSASLPKSSPKQLRVTRTSSSGTGSANGGSGRLEGKRDTEAGAQLLEGGSKDTD